MEEETEVTIKSERIMKPKVSKFKIGDKVQYSQYAFKCLIPPRQYKCSCCSGCLCTRPQQRIGTVTCIRHEYERDIYLVNVCWVGWASKDTLHPDFLEIVKA